MNKYFITGIGTNVGKTLISAILTEALETDYWKPIQAGNLENSDTQKVQHLITNSKTNFHSESYRLYQAMSPHAAAKIDGIEINLDNIQLPKTDKHLIIEGAGGLMVPLNNQDLMIDLIKKLNVEVILVSQNYLGSINHTILSVEALKNWNIPVKGILFNGDKNENTESFITSYTQIPILGRITQHKEITKAVILRYKNQFNQLK